MNRKEPQPLQKGLNGTIVTVTDGRNPTVMVVKKPAPPSPTPPPKTKN